MNQSMRIVLTVLLIALCGGMFVVGYVFLKKNRITQANSLKRKAKKEYSAHEYWEAAKTYQRLIDSLKVNEDEVALNYAHASLLSSFVLKKAGYTGRIAGGEMPESDSVRHQFEAISLNEYGRLAVSGNQKIASIAANQLGFATMKKVDQENNIDSLFSASLAYFKDALIKNPENDSARYNYELLKKIVRYPETIVTQAKALVAQKRYKEAAKLLENAMKRDKRLKAQESFLNRIKTIVGIDSLKNRNL